MPYENDTPEISDALITFPDVSYSPTVPALEFVTNKSDPEMAIPNGPDRPEIRDALMVFPDVSYSPIVPAAKFATNKSDPETAIP